MVWKKLYTNKHRKHKDIKYAQIVLHVWPEVYAYSPISIYNRHDPMIRTNEGGGTSQGLYTQNNNRKVWE